MLKPLGDRLLVEYSTAESKTAGGIYIPDSAKEKPHEGVVLAVGKDVEEVKAGDRVIFGKYSPDKITMDGVEYAVIKEEDVMGVIVAGKKKK
ncbi:MAG: co-chaperone GroES [Nitrospirae bacterium CG18_big_fil_WC_8_21_14_2_50_70_55]|nr:co-chaperone GroES [Deltaproteobacteria bacterium]OIP66125.1 MAG: co-chaperone GroES [Nitrospirae bacterium CG2_30_70_394]PIQ03251.1 MAG: co-chaperone GroES [Nitrospirae bacterium CG18_big_fil_WC_8_21_14_2_50_70_55]PIU77490.1 MAG: co-chaperone GroES [Nitrospirae bacterium CG06_land_8_20_14_3_00_70_43]PIW83066.1 MAG: co-chaperone GroES [Nitrospirae bacterium CG_4_8_14_3_um_filter_70_85]PIX83273.1 MAG: co-chaperone GroES [Nitrospirae bacterium CG_4_10_14_3_um_filter_70_108]PJB96033.1 MAG: co